MKSFFVIAVALLIFQSGCTRPVGQKEVVVDPDHGPPIVETIQTMNVSAPQSVVDAAHQALGDSGQIPPAKDLTIPAGEVSITLHPGATIDYRYNEDDSSMLFAFNEPRPTITASVAGLEFHPPLISLKLLPNNTGIARVHTLIGNIERVIPFNFGVSISNPEEVKAELEAAAKAAAEPPAKKEGVVRFHTMAGCGPCEKGKKELAEAKKAGKLPFEYEVTEDEVDFTPDRPVMTCLSAGTVWTPAHAQDDPKKGVKKGDPRPGWYGVEDAIAWWKVVPKK
jgi:hypothetical protein